MELSANFSFNFKSASMGVTIPIGVFKNSHWSFVMSSNYGMDITRSNTSQSFAINVNISVFAISITTFVQQVVEKKHYMRSIVDGEKNVLIPFNFVSPRLSQRFTEFRGTFSILQLPASFSKEAEASNNSLTLLIPPLVENVKLSPQLSEDFIRLLNNPNAFPDATLKCGADEILVHKGVLSVRSSVFAAMFNNQMQEGSSGIVDIVDIEPKVLQATLKYVYSGKTDHVTDAIVNDVLFVADKYELEELKKVCIDKLKSSLTVDNIFHILVLGNLHDESLKRHAKEFVSKCDRFSNLEKTEGWKLLQSENPGLAIEVLLFVVKSKEL